MRRNQLLGAVALVWSALACGGTVGAQNVNRTNPGLQLIVEPDYELRQMLNEARQTIDKKQYNAAVQLLQRVLERPEDNFTGRDSLDDRGSPGGIRRETLRLLMSLPTDGQAAYELAFGATAREMLSEAIESDDRSGIAEVARRFTAASAGYDAITLLAAYASDANRPLQAALLLEPLRDHPRASPQYWLHSAIYWSRAGRMDRSLKSLAELKRSTARGKLRIGGRDVDLPEDSDSLKWLRSFVPTTSASETAVVTTWSMPGGGPSRNASATATSLAGGSVWRVSTLEHLTLDGRVEEDRRHRARFQEAMNRALQSLQEENRPVLPASQPLVIGDTVVYRTIGDVTAVSLRTGELLWRSSLLDETLVRMLNTRSLESRLRMGRGANLQSHLERRIYRDVAAGTLSSDGETVFALEELDENSGGAFESQPTNKLVAYDLAGGRLLWEAGGPRGSKPAELSSEYFLGPPLPVDDRLYVLSETQGVLQLLVLKQDADRQTAQVEWSQTLVATDRPITSHVPRRLSGVSPSISDGVLVCPTSSGAVVAIDVVRRSLLWIFQYRTLVRPELQNVGLFQRPQPPEFLMEETDRAARWMDSAPLIADGRILITPRDSDQLYCLDLIDGRELWKHERGDGMYVACAVDGRVVLVGREGVSALQLSDGAVVDSFRIPGVEPSGRGVRVGQSYFLPTANGEIATIDLRSGNVLVRSKLADNLTPGNLAAGGGAIVSLSANELVGFSPLPSIEQRIAEELKSDPESPLALALRGELRLHRGEQAEGFSDLRASLRHKRDSRVESVLAAALLAAVRADPVKINDVAPELESITSDPQQKNEFLQLYSQSLEAAGDRGGAFTQMIRLAGTARFLDDLKPIETGYAVRTDRTIRARLVDMYSAASSEERVGLDRALALHIRTAPAGLGLAEHLERCLRFFRGLPGAESAMLQSARSLNEEQRPMLLGSLMQSGDPATAARATAMRCDEHVKKRQWNEAVPLIKRLGREFADRECLGAQTGRSLAAQWSALPELRTLLEIPSVWPGGSINPNREDRDATIALSILPAEILSRGGAQLAGWSFETDSFGSYLLARDPVGVQRWKLAIPVDDLNGDVTRNMPIPCQIRCRDHWLVVSRASFFVVIDTSAATAPRVAWQQTLRSAAASAMESIGIGRNRRYATQTNGYGRVIGLTPESVIYSIGSKLMSGDLETGRTAWSRLESGAAVLDGTADDRAIAIHLNGGVMLLRTLDGASIAKRTQLTGLPIWESGSRQIAHRFRTGGVTVEYRDLERGQVIWSRECPSDTLSTVVDDEDVAFLEPTGLLVMARLGDGRERYRAELPLKLGTRDKNWFAVQRTVDRDVILGGERASQVTPFDPSGSQAAVAFNGYVCAVSPVDGKLQWANPVENAAFDRTQPPSSPVLLLASRQTDRRMINTFPQRYRMLASLIDKRTGREIYATDESAPLQAPRIEPDPSQSRIIANFHEWQLDLTFSGGGPAKPAK